MQGPTALKNIIRQFASEFPEQTGQALLHVATTKTLPTIKMVTPIDKGFLRSSNAVLGPDMAPGVTGIIFWNGMNYAAAVHEMLATPHASGTPKFVEWPLMRDLEEYPRAVLEKGLEIIARSRNDHSGGGGSSDLSPIKADAVSSLVMMNADLETIDGVPLTKMTGLRKGDNLTAFKSASRGIKTATMALGQVIGLNDEQTKYLTFMCAGLELMTGMAEAYAALRALASAKALFHITTGVGAIMAQMAVPPWGLAVAAGAVGGAYIFNEWMTDSMRKADVTVDLDGHDPVGEIKRALAEKEIYI